VPASLPLFPLNAALVPGLVLPLHIFEPRYRRMIEELLARPEESDREFGIIAIRDGQQIETGGLSALVEIGTTAILRGAQEYEDGRFDIVTTGHRRFRLRSISLPSGDPTATFMEGEVDFLDEPECDLAPALVAQVRRLFSQYRALLGQQMFGEEILHPAAPDDQADLAYLVTASMVLPVAERQRLLAALDSRARLIEARNLLVRETGLITMLSCLPALDVASPGFCPN
jgi:Lon protease-like protein